MYAGTSTSLDKKNITKSRDRIDNGVAKHFYRARKQWEMDSKSLAPIVNLTSE